MKPLLFVSPLRYFAPSIIIMIFNNELYAQAETVEHTLRSVFTRGFLNEISMFSNPFCRVIIILIINDNNNNKNPQMVALLLLSSLRRLWMKQGTENINSSPPLRFLTSLCVFSRRSCRCMLGRPRPNRLISPLYR